MAKAVKMMDVVVAGRMAKMRVVVTEPHRVSPFAKAGEMVSEAMRLSGEAELNTRPRSLYRNSLIN